MNREQFKLAINWLRQQDPPFKLPFNAMPGELEDGEEIAFTEDTWNSHRWNPPGAVVYAPGVRDPAAGAKPTWAQLTAALAQAELAQARDRAVAEVRQLCRRKITTQGYEQKTEVEEIFFRLRGGATTAQDAERERLRGVCAARETAINAATTAAAVERLLAESQSDSFWATPPTGN